MTEERAVLAGGCFWGVQDLIRRYDGVLSTRVGLRQRFVHFPHTTTGLPSRTRDPAEVVCAGD
jgi:peptide methionine sulfoxide reductase MsrA